MQDYKSQRVAVHLCH